MMSQSEYQEQSALRTEKETKEQRRRREKEIRENKEQEDKAIRMEQEALRSLKKSRSSKKFDEDDKVFEFLAGEKVEVRVTPMIAEIVNFLEKSDPTNQGHVVWGFSITSQSRAAVHLAQAR